MTTGRIGDETWGLSMCGITGAVWTEPGKAVDEVTLRRMVEVLTHRGPDGDGLYTTGLRGAGPGSRGGRRPRAPAIGDHRPGRRAPAAWPTRTSRCGSSSTARSTTSAICAVASKERDTAFSTASDTETIVHLYEDEGSTSSGISTGCSRWRSGMPAGSSWSWPATAWARSRSFTAGSRAGCCSPAS